MKASTTSLLNLKCTLKVLCVASEGIVGVFSKWGFMGDVLLRMEAAVMGVCHLKERSTKITFICV